MLGQYLRVGDKVAYATLVKGGKVAQKVGVIVELEYAKENRHGEAIPPLVRVRVDCTSNGSAPQQRDLATTHRMVKLN